MLDYMDMAPYSLAKKEKEQYLTKELSELTRHHYANCDGYKRILDSISFDIQNIKTYYDIPFLPVRLFKEYDLRSIEKDQIQKTMTSSGTSGQQVSKIYLDKETSANQTKILTRIVSSYIGKILRHF
jgi:phenylacetate-coenzyme A ligase PaaK-like adenylate-forming protein